MPHGCTPGPLRINDFLASVSNNCILWSTQGASQYCSYVLTNSPLPLPPLSADSLFATPRLYSSVQRDSSCAGQFLGAMSCSSLPSALINQQSSCYKYNLQQPMRVALRSKRPILLRYRNAVSRLLLSESMDLGSVWLRHHADI